MHPMKQVPSHLYQTPVKIFRNNKPRTQNQTADEEEGVTFERANNEIPVSGIGRRETRWMAGGEVRVPGNEDAPMKRQQLTTIRKRLKPRSWMSETDAGESKIKKGI